MALNKEQLYVLALLRNAFGRKTETSDFDDANRVSKMILRNGICQTVFEKLPPNLKQCLHSSYFATLRLSMLHEKEGEEILRSLSSAGVDCMALKGWKLRKLYPNVYMRQMADLDIFVRSYQYATIESVMEKMGYDGEGETIWKHDNFIKQEVHVDLHRRLTDGDKVFRKWEKELWQRAIQTKEEHVYEMTPEDFRIYHFVHLYGDFKNGALGLRRIVDTWLLANQVCDEEFVRMELGNMGILTFYEKMNHLCRVTMGEEPLDEDTEILLQHAFKYGIYGSSLSYKAGRIVSMGGSIRTGKLKSLMAAVFLPVSRMKAHFPILEKHPILLPICWIKRIFSFTKHGWKGIKKYGKALNYEEITDKEYQDVKRVFKAGGIT